MTCEIWLQNRDSHPQTYLSLKGSRQAPALFRPKPSVFIRHFERNGPGRGTHVGGGENPRRKQRSWPRAEVPTHRVLDRGGSSICNKAAPVDVWCQKNPEQGLIHLLRVVLPQLLLPEVVSAVPERG